MGEGGHVDRQPRGIREPPGCWSVLSLDWGVGHTGVNTFQNSANCALKIYAFTYVQIIQKVKINSTSHIYAFSSIIMMIFITFIIK